jgi:anti-anti-sigma factor
MDVGLEIVEDCSGERMRLAVRGSLDIGTAPGLCLRLTRLRASGPLDAVLDLSALEFCDPSGLRAVILEAREAEIERGRLQVIPPVRGAARHLFEVSGAAQMLRVQPPVHPAVAT